MQHTRKWALLDRENGDKARNEWHQFDGKKKQKEKLCIAPNQSMPTRISFSLSLFPSLLHLN